MNMSASYGIHQHRDSGGIVHQKNRSSQHELSDSTVNKFFQMGGWILWKQGQLPTASICFVARDIHFCFHLSRYFRKVPFKNITPIKYFHSNSSYWI